MIDIYSTRELLIQQENLFLKKGLSAQEQQFNYESGGYGNGSSEAWLVIKKEEMWECGLRN